MIKGTIYIDNNMDMERLITILANNGYSVKLKEIETLDAFCAEYRIDYKRKDEYDEP